MRNQQIDTKLCKYQQIFTSYLHHSDLKISLLIIFVLWHPTIAPPVSSIYFAPTTFASPTWKVCEVRKSEQEEWIYPLTHCSYPFGAIPVNAWVSKRMQEKERKGSCIDFTNQESWLWPSCIQALLHPPCSSCCSEHVCLNLRWKILETFSDLPQDLAASKGHIGLPLFLRPCAVSRHPCVHLLTSRHAGESGQSVTFQPGLQKLQTFHGFQLQFLHVWTKSLNSPAETWSLPSKSCLISPRY